MLIGKVAARLAFLAALCAASLMETSVHAQDRGPASPRAGGGPGNAPAADGLSAAALAMRDTARRVNFEAEGRTLMGWIYKPRGDGPFPAVLWNHGSERNPVRHPELALFYVSHGYVLFLPVRHGHGDSPGEYIGDESRARIIEAHELYNLDVAAALEWLKKQPYVDSTRLAVTGVSYGGIQTLLLAEKNVGVRAYIPFAPGAMSWANPAIRARELAAVKNAKAPIFLLQAQNDFSIGPSEILGPVITAKGELNRAKLYPAFGMTHADGHGGFASKEQAIAIWGPDVLQFLEAVGMGPSP